MATGMGGNVSLATKQSVQQIAIDHLQYLHVNVVGKLAS